MTTPRQFRRAGRRASLAALGAACLTALGATGTQDAVANGDTRTLTIVHEHTKESATVTFRRNGSYDQAALKELNWLLRDWRLDEPTRMEPKLFDIVWEVYREVGSQEPIRVVSAYRSPRTNAMLRRRSRAVAEHSQHMLGKAMDFYLPDVPMSRVREVGMRIQNGGVGFYPNAFNPFVHLDAGSVRSWPRMSTDQLARLFPDGKTVHLPREGRPLGRYEEARAEILSRGGSVAGVAGAQDGEDGGGTRKSLWATLFGGGDDEDSEFYRSPASRQKQAAPTRVASADETGRAGDGGNLFRSLFGSFDAPAQPAAETAPATGRRGRATERVVAARAPDAASPAPAAAPVPMAADTTPVDSDNPATTPTTIALAALPVPPRRPEEFGSLLAAGTATAPLPPTRPGAIAGSAPAVAAGINGQMRIASEPAATPPALARPVPADSRAALRALFEAVATPAAPDRRAAVTTSRTRAEPILAALALDDAGARIRMVFSSAQLDPANPLSADAFSGPAVAPLPLIR